MRYASKLLPARWYCLPLRISRSPGKDERDVHPDPFGSRGIVLPVPRGFPGVSGVVSGTVDLGTTNVVKWEVAADAKHRISGMHRHVIGVDSHRSWLPIG
jgi:hypothetical protein